METQGANPGVAQVYKPWAGPEGRKGEKSPGRQLTGVDSLTRGYVVLWLCTSFPSDGIAGPLSIQER